LAQLDRFLQAALVGEPVPTRPIRPRGRVVFVTGMAGQGKTALLQEFARRAQAAHPDLVVAAGSGNAHTGQGDPYLPFRQILALLTGDVEARYASGALSQDQAGERAARLSAHQQAVAHFRQGLRWLETLPQGPQRARLELSLSLGLATSLQAITGYRDPEVGRLYT
jgi:predicted ATPase